MSRTHLLTSAVLLTGLAAPAVAQTQMVTMGAPSSQTVAQHASKPGTVTLTHAEKLQLLQKNIKYVFVLFQENRSFDQHFGTFPGVDGLFSQSPANTPGFVQPIVNTDGSLGSISPFLIPQTIKDATGKTVALYPADTDSVDHSHTGIDNSLNLSITGTSQNNRYALNEEGLTTDTNGNVVALATLKPATSNPTLVQKQRAELVMAHLDCDTIPFLWQFADRFALFDNFHQTIIGPSTPNAIAMIAGQSGDTQWALHPSQSAANIAGTSLAASGGVPVTGDPGPFPGSDLDTSAAKPSYGPADVSPAKPTLNQTYASLPLSFLGPDINAVIANDQNPALDLLDVQNDIRAIASRNLTGVPWGWYQEGYDHEPTDGSGPASNALYITHHNGPQYFGYVGDNPTETTHLHGLGDFFADIGNAALPAQGVFYVRGGYGNLSGLTPSDPTPTVQAAFAGDDDHPGYSDAQIAQSLLAREVNAIAASPYWANSAIIITYDETDGLYDHQAITPRTRDSNGFPLDGGPRIPSIVISPYGMAHALVHQYSEHSSVIKFIDALFRLTPLGNLPDEVRGRALGLAEFGQANLGPADTLAGMGDLFPAFDNARLTGATPPLPASYAMIPDADVTSLPPYGGKGCYTLNIVPTDYQGGRLIDPPPADFNPRPGTSPGVPAAGGWTP